LGRSRIKREERRVEQPVYKYVCTSQFTKDGGAYKNDSINNKKYNIKIATEDNPLR
jgi:hypothetical protein